MYQKSDGKYYYGLIIKDSMTWFQADEACKLKGGRLPEITDFSEHFNIVKLKVTNIIHTNTLQSRPWAINENS